MTPEEKIHHHTRWLLDKIQYQYLLASNRLLSYNTGNIDYSDEKVPTIEARNKLMLRLEKLRVIDIKDEPEYKIGSGTNFNIEILQPKFNQLYNLYQNTLNTGPTELTKIVEEWAYQRSGDAQLSLKVWELTKLSKAPKETPSLFNKKHLYTPDLKPQIEVGPLAAYSDGTIRYQGEIIELRNQLKDLCRLFMENPDRVLTSDDMKEHLIATDKRKNTSRSTIAKYVSELRNSLKIHFKKDVIFNQKEEGWYFNHKK